jgi:CheY-like chemotaxis protein
LSQLLQLEGYETDTAADGLEAMDRLAQRLPDLILLDLLMPRMDGVQFLESIRGDERFKKLPVIMVTGQHDSRKQSRAMELGAREYLFKAATPFNRLLGILQKHLGDEAPQRPVKDKPEAKAAPRKGEDREEDPDDEDRLDSPADLPAARTRDRAGEPRPRTKQR